MGTQKKIVTTGELGEAWAPQFREMGMEFTKVQNLDEALRESAADIFLVDAREPHWIRDLSRLKEKVDGPILSFVRDSIGRDDLMKLKTNGAEGYVTEKTPPEEVVFRVKAMLSERLHPERRMQESRSAKRIWFQQMVDFSVFNQNHRAWSTTLSETGIFLRTNLTFPMHSPIHLKFNFFGDSRAFETAGVIVRQEVEGDLRGLGVMFQNLNGENVRVLESFLDLHR